MDVSLMLVFLVRWDDEDIKIKLFQTGFYPSTSALFHQCSMLIPSLVLHNFNKRQRLSEEG
jgi:hypothetical protein